MPFATPGTGDVPLLKPAEIPCSLPEEVEVDHVCRGKWVFAGDDFPVPRLGTEASGLLDSWVVTHPLKGVVVAEYGPIGRRWCERLRVFPGFGSESGCADQLKAWLIMLNRSFCPPSGITR